MDILLTGSSGTIGTRLFETLLQQGHNVTGIDRRPNAWKPELNLRTLQFDLTRPDALQSAPSADMLIHFAANARVYELVQRPELALENMMSTFHALEFARKRNIPKILFASSRETYGNIMGKRAIGEEDVHIRNCESPYAASKLTGEAYVHSYAASYGMKSVVLRFSNVYGMYDDSDRVIPLWIRQLQRGEHITVYGKEKTLDFTHMDDCIDGIVRCIDRFPKAAGHAFNIASGKDATLLHVAEKLSQLLQANGKMVVKDNRPGEVWKFRANISKAKKMLGYAPKIGIEEGLIKTVAWYQFHKVM